MRRPRQTPEALEAKRLKEQSKLKDYLALTDDVLNKVGMFIDFIELH